MKRLKYYLLGISKSGKTNYEEIYKGEMIQTAGYIVLDNGKEKDTEEEVFFDSTYWYDDIGFEFSKTNKHSLDKPTITIKIPIDKLGIAKGNYVVADYFLRAFKPYIDKINADNYNSLRPDKENGKYYIYSPSPEILVRNASYFKISSQKYYENKNANIISFKEQDLPLHMYLCITIQVQLPYKNYKKSIQMLTKELPSTVEDFINKFNKDELKETLLLAEKQSAIVQWLKNSDYCCFIANGSILPRFKGTSLPLEDAIPFKSPLEDEIQINGIRGMGIKKGVTVITGGGYSGKSTLLDAISSGIYNHTLGDGRELVITDESAVKISAEDGRSVKNVNITPFIKWLPKGNTYNFSTDYASGSTSQGANIMEAINYGSTLLLIDEDKSATNFMIRDETMKTLIEKEPITPFTDRVNELYKENKVSTILVIGGSGEYLSVADKIYMMDDYKIKDVTKKAKEIVPTGHSNIPEKVIWNHSRILLKEGFSPYVAHSGKEKLIVSDMGFIIIGNEKIDVRMLHNIVSTAQLNALGFILRKLEATAREDRINIIEKIDELYNTIENQGIDYVFTNSFTTCERFLDLPRKHEILAVINRMRNITMIQE